MERNDGLVSVYKTKIIGTEEFFPADRRYIERLVKFLLWAKGGFKITLCGNEKVGNSIKEDYRLNGTREFDRDFMSDVYDHDLTVSVTSFENTPKEKNRIYNFLLRQGYSYETIKEVLEDIFSEEDQGYEL